MWQCGMYAQGFSRCSTEPRCGFSICITLRWVAGADFSIGEHYGAARCGSSILIYTYIHTVRCGAVRLEIVRRVTFCGSVKDGQNRTALTSKFLGLKGPKGFSRFLFSL